MTPPQTTSAQATPSSVPLQTESAQALPAGTVSPQAVPVVSQSRRRVIPVVADGVLRNNAVTVQMLALCPMLAVTTSVASAAVLGGLTAATMALSGFIVALVRGMIPRSTRLPIFLLIVSGLVGALDVLSESFVPDVHRKLGIFLPLIITNCAVLARLEVFASRQSLLLSTLDGISTGMGMLLAITSLAALREFATTLGIASAQLPAGGFILFALMLATLRLASPKNNGG